MKVEVKISADEKGWTTTVTMPDGREISKRWDYQGHGTYTTESKLDWDEDGLPEPVVEVADWLSGTGLSRFIRETSSLPSREANLRQSAKSADKKSP